MRLIFPWLLPLLIKCQQATGCDDFGDCDDDEHIRERRSVPMFYQTGKELASKTSLTLDQLLGSHYDKRIRPNFGSKSVKVTLNLSIRSMGPVSEKSQSYFLDCYFRQSWRDDRLSFNVTGVTQLPLNWQFLTKIWRPDTFFINGKKSKMHKITVPNRFIRIMPDGSASYSQRLTIHAQCKMSLKKFPLDSQVCQLLIGSYGFTADEVFYDWAPKPLSIAALGLAQFHMVRWEHGVTTNITNRKIAMGFRNDSVAYLNFYFERQTGFFLLQIYTPLLLIVMCSWVAFWIVKTDVPARCGLGTITVLSVTKIGFGGKGKPQVGYPTALDIFVLICFAFVFAALVEFAVINFITLFIKRYKEQEEKEKDAMEKLVKAVNDQLQKSSQSSDKEEEEDVAKKVITVEVTEASKVDAIEVVSVDEITIEKESIFKQFKDLLVQYLNKFEFIKSSVQAIRGLKGPEWAKLKPVPQMYIYTNTEDALDAIDEYSRKIFPFCFLFTMLIYWTTYLYLFQDELDV